MTSRERFEAWHNKWLSTPDAGNEWDFEIWQAGRQSMKDEVLKACDYINISRDLTGKIRVLANAGEKDKIKEIEP